MSASAEKKVLDLASKGGILRPRDLQSRGLPTDYLWRLHQKEKLEKVGRGMYAIPGAGLSEHQTIVQAANHFVVSGSKPSGLFWFSTSRLFTEARSDGPSSIATHLARPEIIFQPIWATPVDDKLHSLVEEL